MYFNFTTLILIFSCALIPKAVGSVLVMLFELMHKWEHLLQQDGTLSASDLECVLLEVMRLYPPFIGNIKVIPLNHLTTQISEVFPRVPKLNKDY